MAVLKAKDIKKMKIDEARKKLGDLRSELIRAEISAAKGGSAKIREIKKAIARILTINPEIKQELKHK